MNSQLCVQNTPNFSMTLQKSLDRHDILVFMGMHDYFTASFFQEVLPWTTDTPLKVLDPTVVQGNQVHLNFREEEQIYLLDLRKIEFENGNKNFVVRMEEMNGRLLILCNQEMNIEIRERPSNPAPANFMLQDLRFEENELRTALNELGIGEKECASLFSLTDGDAALVLYVLNNYRDVSGLNIVKAKKDILRTYTWLLEKGFSTEELKWICLLRHFDNLDLSALDKLWPNDLNRIGLISGLCNLGMIIQPEWDTCKCSAPLRMTLERLAYMICNTDEKQLQEELAVNYMRQTGQWEEALKLVSSVDHPVMLNEVLHDILSDIDILSNAGAIKTCYDMLQDRTWPKSPETLLLSLLHEHYAGQCSAKGCIAGQLAGMWDECLGKRERFLTTATILIVATYLQQGMVSQAEEFLQSTLRGIAFENDENLAQLELISLYIQGIMNLEFGDQQKIRKAKYGIMSHGDSRVWMFFMQMFFEEDIFLMLFTSEEYEHFLDKVMSGKRKGLSEERRLAHQIFYHLFCIRMRHFPVDSDDQEVMLVHKIGSSNSDYIKMWGHYMLAVGKLSRNELNLAGAHIDEMLYHVRMVGCPSMRFRGLLTGARIAAENNRLERSERFLNDAKAMDGFYQWESFAALVAQEESIWHYLHEDPDSAIDCALRMLSVKRKMGNDLGILESLIRLSSMQSKQGGKEVDLARKNLMEAVSIARKNNEVALLDRYLEEHPHLMELMELEGSGGEDPGNLEASNLHIMLFSECQICHGDKVLREEDWPTRKVKGIFQYLLLHSEQRIARIALAREFWPEIGDATQALANLRVALSLLGKTLGLVNLEHMLMRNRQRAWLEIPEKARIDYLTFQESYEAGKTCYKQRDYRNAKRHFSASLKVLEKPFLSTQVKDKWAEKEKAKVAKKKERCQYYLLHIALANQQYANAVVYCKKMLEENSYREDIYLILISTLKKQGRVGEALGAYKRYKKILNEELKLSPSKDMLVMEKKLANTVY